MKVAVIGAGALAGIMLLRADAGTHDGGLHVPVASAAAITALAAAHLAHDWLCVLAEKAGVARVDVGHL